MPKNNYVKSCASGKKDGTTNISILSSSTPKSSTPSLQSQTHHNNPILNLKNTPNQSKKSYPDLKSIRKSKSTIKFKSATTLQSGKILILPIKSQSILKQLLCLTNTSSNVLKKQPNQWFSVPKNQSKKWKPCTNFQTKINTTKLRRSTMSSCSLKV